MTLKKKILIGYGVAFALMTLVIAWAVTNLISLGKASDAILRENYRSIQASDNMEKALDRQRNCLLLMLMRKTRTEMIQLYENDARFLEWLARAKDNITIKDETEHVQAIEYSYTQYRLKLLQKINSHNFATSMSETEFESCINSLQPLFIKVQDACMKLRRLNENTMYTASKKAGYVAQRAIWSTVIVALTALMIALVFSLFIAERIVRPLHRFMQASRKISAGEYAVKIPEETQDELGHLAREFNRMASQLERYHEMNIEQIVSEKNKGEAILSSIADGLVVFDTGLRITGINPAARQMLNLEFTDCTILQCEDILICPDVYKIIKETIDTGILPVVPDEKRIISFTESDHPKHYLFSITVIRGKDGKLFGIVLLLKDITQLKEVERLKSEFVMAASHELRTPLTGMGMSIDLLLEHSLKYLPEKDQELLQVAHEDIHRMKALVNDLLDLSKIETGRIELEYENIPASMLLERIQTVFKGQFEMKKIIFTSNPVDESIRMRADTNKVTWVLSNLISNALRYVKEGGHIQVVMEKIGSYVHLSVCDDGPGIPLEYQTRIFQKFVQVKGRDSGRGAGLGLAICKEIVYAHGGTIWVESQPGQGSIFTFTLPAV